MDDEDGGQLAPEPEQEHAEAENGGLPGLAEKLEHLFAVVPKPSGGRYSNETAAAALAGYGVKVSSVHLSHLRTGRRNNPSARLLGALAQLFGVEIGYFFDPAIERKANADLETLKRMAASGGHGVMARGVSSKNIKHLEAILNAIREETRKDVEREHAAGEDDES